MSPFGLCNLNIFLHKSQAQDTPDPNLTHRTDRTGSTLRYRTDPVKAHPFSSCGQGKQECGKKKKKRACNLKEPSGAIPDFLKIQLCVWFVHCVVGVSLSAAMSHRKYERPRHGYESIHFTAKQFTSSNKRSGAAPLDLNTCPTHINRNCSRFRRKKKVLRNGLGARVGSTFSMVHSANGFGHIFFFLRSFICSRRQ